MDGPPPPSYQFCLGPLILSNFELFIKVDKERCDKDRLGAERRG